MRNFWTRPASHARRIVVFLAVAVLVGAPVRAADPDALWNIVHNKCMVSVAPCALVDMTERVALLKDINGIAQYLLLPTDKVTGVEDPVLLKPDTPNYFADAWAHRNAMQAKLPHPIPRDAISLAVNARTARSQNQLHIHIDCLKPEAREALKAASADVGTSWAPLSVPVAGHMFLARKVSGESLNDFNPFRTVATTLSDPATEMYRRNVVVVGADFADGPGFIALTDQAPAVPLGFGGGEDVQDHACAVAK